MRGIRRTSEGLELAGVTLTTIIAAATLLGILLSGIANGMQAREQLRNATPRARTDSVIARVAHHDTVLAGIRDTLLPQVRAEIAALRTDVMGLNCQRAGYPSPFCDNIPRVGAPLSTPTRKDPSPP
jgi:hypothetical protein